MSIVSLCSNVLTSVVSVIQILNPSHVKDYVSKFKTYISVDISSFAEKWGKELVKKTVNIPKWVNTKAENLKINFSKTLEEALLQKIYKE